MRKYLLLAKGWFTARQTRERLLVLLLCWAFIYFIFSFFFFRPLDKRKNALNTEIKTLQDQLTSWNNQITTLKKLSDSPLFKMWLKEHQALQSLQGQYKFLSKASPTKQWQDVIKTLLHSQPNITVAEIKNLPETLYNPAHLPTTSTKIYQQELVLVIMSDYFDTVHYLERLEEVLPNIHWNNLHYQVMQYPTAKIEMEFSIIYGKT